MYSDVYISQTVAFGDTIKLSLSTLYLAAIAVVQQWHKKYKYNPLHSSLLKTNCQMLHDLEDNKNKNKVAAFACQVVF